MSATTINYARLIAIPLPFAMAGYSYACSHAAIPAILDQPPQHSTPAFSKLFHSGAAVAIPTTLLAGVAQSYLAYALPAQRTMWAVAAASVFSIVPFTRLVMIPTGITRLLQISVSGKEQEKVAANLEHRQLLQKWVWQNYVRAVLLTVSGVVAVAAGGI